MPMAPVGGGVPPGSGSGAGPPLFSFPQVPVWAAEPGSTAPDNPVAVALQERLGQVLGMAGVQTRRGSKRPLQADERSGEREPEPRQPRTAAGAAVTAAAATNAASTDPSLERVPSDAIVHISVISQTPTKAAPRSQRKTAARAAAPTAGTAPSHRVPTKSVKAVPSSASGTFTSLYRGVTRHRLTGRFEAHFWDSSYVRQQNQPTAGAPTGRKGRSKGRQVYLGGYANEEEAARAYDKAALAFLGPTAPTNFPLGDYAGFLVESVGQSPEEVVAALRRGSVGFARGRSQFRGVTKAQQHGKYEARLGKADGAGRPLFLGVFDSAEEAARAHDRAAVKLRGRTAVTNYALADYADIMRNPDSYDLDAMLADAEAAAALAGVAGAGHGSPTGQLLAVQTRARARTETGNTTADPVAPEASEHGRAESAAEGGAGLTRPPPLTLPLPMPPLQSYLEGTRGQQQGQQRFWAPALQLGGSGADSAAAAAAAAAAMLAGQTSLMVHDASGGLVQPSYPALLGPWAAQWGHGLPQQRGQLQAPPVVLSSILVAKHGQATHDMSIEQQQQQRRLLSSSNAGGQLASPLSLGAPGTGTAPGVSPLAASLLSPLGLATEGRWRDSPLEKLFNSNAPALPSFPAFPQLQGQVQLNGHGSLGIGGNGGAGSLGTCPPPPTAAQPNPQAQDDIWGALSWLESLDLAQLTSITAKNQTEGAGTPGGAAATDAVGPAAPGSAAGHGAGSSYDSVQPEPSVNPY